jgi:hypothetical protein
LKGEASLLLLVVLGIQVFYLVEVILLGLGTLAFEDLDKAA